MTAYIIRRSATAIVVLFGVSVFIFLMLHVIYPTPAIDVLGPHANKLINASVSGGNPSAVKAEASYLTEQQPSLFQPNADSIIVWKDDVSGQPAAIEAMTQYYLNTELLYLTK